MESLLNRYRNITVLLLVIAGQLILLAVQVKDNRDIHLVRVWTVTAVTPFARVVEWLRGGSTGFLHNYILLHNTDAENRALRQEVGRLKMDNIFLRNELSQADRASALQLFQAHTQSKTLAASIIGAGAASGSKAVYVDRGSVEGVQRGMAVVTPDGIVGKVIASYPTASEVLLITDPDFAAGVISQKNQTRGTLKGQGNGPCKVEYVPSEEKVEVGEWFYTSGDDRIFPRGFPVGVITAVHDAQPYREILVEPSGMQHGLEDVLIILSGVHEEIPNTPPGNQPVYIAPAPPEAVKSSAATDGTAAGATGGTSAATGVTEPSTEADRLRAHYKALGDAQNHVFGENLPGAKPPNFNLVLPPGGAKPAAAAPPAKPRHAARRRRALMEYSDSRILLNSQREGQVSRFRAWVMMVVPLAAILFQFFVPRFFEFLHFVEMPLLVVVYFAVVRRSQISGLMVGAVVGLAQDSLSKHPLGMFGIVKTLVGYFAASVGLRIDVDHAMVRLVLTFFFYIFHQVLYWVMVRALLSQPMQLELQSTLLLALLNAVIGVALFHFLDKLRER